MKEIARAVDNAFWRAQTNVPDIYTKGRVRLAAALRETVKQLQEYGTVDVIAIGQLCDELEAL